MTNIWILIAQNSYAAFYKFDQKENSLQLIERLEHPEGKLKQEELTTDHLGRSKSMNSPGKHGMGQQVSPSERERNKFIHKLCEYLDLAYEQHRFKELILVAAPQFRGELKKTLPNKFHSLISKEISDDLHDSMTESEISKHLLKKLNN